MQLKFFDDYSTITLTDDKGQVVKKWRTDGDWPAAR